jgi:carbon-monoxide dehydrogenase iron sulfur subunit
MGKVICIDQEKCTGCRVCEMACSIKHAGVVNPLRSRIKVDKSEWEGIYVPVACQQCESPVCLSVCPVNAISRDTNLNCIVIDYNRCIGCRMCVNACPFGGMSTDPITEKIIKCDLCGGDPQCVRFCETKAVQYVDEADVLIDSKISLSS